MLSQNGYGVSAAGPRPGQRPFVRGAAAPHTHRGGSPRPLPDLGVKQAGVRDPGNLGGGSGKMYGYCLFSGGGYFSVSVFPAGFRVCEFGVGKHLVFLIFWPWQQ